MQPTCNLLQPPCNPLQQPYNPSAASLAATLQLSAASLQPHAAGLQPALTLWRQAFERDASAGVGCSFRVVQEAALLLLPYLGNRVVRTAPATLGALLRARVVPLPVEGNAQGDAEADADADAEGEAALAAFAHLAPELAEVQAALAACGENGCCVVACESGATGARAAVVVMKYTDKAVVFVSAGEAAAAQSSAPPLAGPALGPYASSGYTWRLWVA